MIFELKAAGRAVQLIRINREEVQIRWQKSRLVGIPVKLLSIEVKFRENEISENQAYLEFRAGSKSYLSSEEPILVKLEMTR